ncbi:MAG: DAK2 domain-containing protein [Martelella sp.]
MGRVQIKTIASALAIAAALAAAPASAETLKMAWSQDATGLDPHKQTAFASIRLLELVYEPLVRTDAELNVVPAIAAYEAALPEGFGEALKAMAEAAEEGRDSTVDMVARLGRASRLGERSRGVLDAGATSCALILTTLAGSVATRLSPT